MKLINYDNLILQQKCVNHKFDQTSFSFFRWQVMHAIYMLLVKYWKCFLHLQGMQTIFSMVFFLIFTYKDKKFGRKSEKFCENTEEKKVGPCRACGVCFFQLCLPLLTPPVCKAGCCCWFWPRPINNESQWPENQLVPSFEIWNLQKKY